MNLARHTSLLTQTTAVVVAQYPTLKVMQSIDCDQPAISLLRLLRGRMPVEVILDHTWTAYSSKTRQWCTFPNVDEANQNQAQTNSESISCR